MLAVGVFDCIKHQFTSGGSTLVSNGGGVAMKSYALSYARIDGYGRPKYETTQKTGLIETSSDIAIPTLKKGLKGPEVAKLQNNLNKLLKINLEVDGDFGKNTDSAVREFQKRYLLEVDGIYGPKSYDAMIDALL